MDENIDPNLNGENAETPTGSPPETITPGEGNEVNQNGAENLSAEEATWNSLKGSTQDRIKDIIREKKTLEDQLQAERSRAMYSNGVPTPQSFGSQVDPDVQAGIRKLSEYGLATKDEVNKTVEDTVNQRLGGLVYNMEMDRLSNRHSGVDGLPAFDKSEYEDFIGRYPQYRNYSPDDVYNKMYEDEIFDAKVKSLGARPQQQAATPSLRPTKTRVQEEPLSPELIEQRLREPDGRQWYERNLDKINAVVAKIPTTE